MCEISLVANSPDIPQIGQLAPEKLLLGRLLVDRNAYLTADAKCKELLDPSPQAIPGCCGSAGRSRRMVLPSAPLAPTLAPVRPCTMGLELYPPIEKDPMRRLLAVVAVTRRVHLYHTEIYSQIDARCRQNAASYGKSGSRVLSAQHHGTCAAQLS